MNELGTTLAWVALQVTLVSLAAAVLYAALSRRGGGALAAGAGLAAAVALTAAALCPLPPWWGWGSGAATVAVVAEAATPSPAAARPAPAAAMPTGSEGTAPGWSLSALRGAWVKVGGAALRSVDQRVPWPKWVALAFLLGAGAGVVRILLGLWGVRECRRRSERIADPALAELLEDLRAGMRVARRVEARELAGLPAPATVGWLRPVVLLPPDWREWSAEERRAVLAHELAHVRRGDYLAGLVARLGVALHFYHPLIYWLAARLHLQQELAADALGAGHSGGRGPYLKALARLALRQDGRPVGWPARTFLSSNGTLMRRVHMLRTKDRFPQYRLPRTVRALAVAVLAAVAVGVSALRSPAQKAEGPAQAAGERFYTGGSFTMLRSFEYKVAAEREPFDLSYLAPDAIGVVAVRPSALFGRPGMKKYADALNKYLALVGKEVGLREGLSLPFDQLEQVSFSAFLKGNQGPEGKSALLFGQPVLRTARDYDWKGRFIDLVPGVKEVSYHGQVYYRVPKGKFPMLEALGVCFYLPDARTLVMFSEEAVRQVIDRKKGERRRFAWEEDWKQVERGLFAVAVDNRDKGWLKDRRQTEDMNEAGLAVARHLNSLVQGVDGGTTFTVTAIGRCESEEDARAVVRAAKELLLRDLVKELEKAGKEKPDGVLGRECRCGLELLRNAHFQLDGACVRWMSEVRVDLAELLGADLAEGASRQHEKK